ncbi:hypothetical protein [Nocardioides sambongensis]|uniref:hypothetical protein n=1 Tax=Nocardioides sambongensis TaxID=2589074 RepID=UPI0015E82FF0|nr:hypothetical protein [Nocardioides sambongensis]
MRQLPLVVMSVMADLEGRCDQYGDLVPDADETVAELVESLVALLGAPSRTSEQRPG